MIPVSKFTPGRRGGRVRLVTLHTSEGARSVDSLAAFLNRAGVNASYHGAVDDRRYESYVNFSHTAWHLRNGNPIADGLCLCAFVKWGRDEWLGHARMLELAAAWVADRCLARGVPIRQLSPTEARDAVRNPNHPGGVIDHWTYTRATGDGDHTDVGDNFPWDVVIRRARQIAKLDKGEPVTTPAQFWEHGITNLGGTRVPAWMIVSATEKRVAALQEDMARLSATLDAQSAQIATLLERHPNPSPPA